MKVIIVLTTLVFILFFGNTFAQDYLKKGYKQSGKASYYADKYHGRKTASGELFDMNKMTAAHPKIPFNSLLKVVNTKNNKSITVRVNDRGPFVATRILDVSKAAALKLDMVKDGIANIDLELIRVGGVPSGEGESDESEDVKTKNDTKDEVKKKEEGTSGSSGTNNSGSSNSSGGSKPASTTSSAGKTYLANGSLKVVKGFGIQIGSFGNWENAVTNAKGVASDGFKEVYLQEGFIEGRKIFRLLVGSFDTEQGARDMLPTVMSKGYSRPVVRKHYGV